MFMKIPGLPYQKIIIESSLNLKQFEEMLRRNTASKQPWFKDVSDDYKFGGSITDRSFKLTSMIKGRNTYSPWIVGNYKPSANGCSVDVVFVIQPVAAILMLLFFVFPQYLSVRSDGSFSIVFALAVLALHFILYYIGFLPEVKRIKEFMENETA